MIRGSQCNAWEATICMGSYSLRPHSQVKGVLQGWTVPPPIHTPQTNTCKVASMEDLHAWPVGWAHGLWVHACDAHIQNHVEEGGLHNSCGAPKLPLSFVPPLSFFVPILIPLLHGTST